MPLLYVSPNGSDSNNGSQGSPFRTIATASRVAQPGDTIHVAPGSYSGGFLTSANGTAAAGITYISDVRSGAKIIGAGTAGNPNKAGWENRGDYVAIQGFEIDGSGAQATSWAFGFYNAGSHVTFQDSVVHDVMTSPAAYTALTAAGNGGAGVMMDVYYGGSDGNVTSNLIYNIGPAGMTSTLVHGIYQTESGVVSNNVVYNVVGDGLTSWHNAKDISFINNTIDQVRGSGILVGSNGSGTGGGFVVINNIIRNALYGIYEEGTTGKNNIYSNNLIYNVAGSALHLQNGLTAKGTILSDPKFMDAGSHDYRLQASSPAINAGTASNAPATDIVGDVRPQGGTVDIGAYESSPSSNGTDSPLSASPENTVVKAGTNQAITDAAGNKWTIVGTGAKVAINGVVDDVTANAVQLAYVKGVVWHQNTALRWWGKFSPTAAWSPAAGTTISPLPAIPPAPPPPAPAPAANPGPSFRDSAGNVWSISAGQVVLNGKIDTTTKDVVDLVNIGGKIWQRKVSGAWLARSNQTWVSASGPPFASKLTPSLAIKIVPLDETFVLTGGDVDFVGVDGLDISFTKDGVANISLGVTPVEVSSVATKSVTVKAGVAPGKMTTSGEPMTLVAGSGSLEIVGGFGAVTYQYAAGNGQLTIENFSGAKGDVLSISSILKTTMKIESDGQDGSKIIFGNSAGGISLKKVAPDVAAASVAINTNV